MTTITSVRLSGRGSRDGEQRVNRRIDARRDAAEHALHLHARTGRALMIRSCARRSFDAATIFIAFVICCVFLTARIAAPEVDQ